MVNYKCGVSETDQEKKESPESYESRKTNTKTLIPTPARSLY